MSSDTRIPTSDIGVGGTVSGSAGTRYQAIDDYPDTTPTDYLALGTTANSFIACGFSNFTVPAGATGISVDVLYYDAEPASGTNSSAGRIRVNATYYDSATHNPSGTTYTSRTKSWATNPAGGSWTVDQVNNVGGTGLNAFGVIGPDSNPVWRVSSVQLRVNYTPANTPITPTVGSASIAGAAGILGLALLASAGAASLAGYAPTASEEAVIFDIPITPSVGGMVVSSMAADAYHNYRFFPPTTVRI